MVEFITDLQQWVAVAQFVIDFIQLIGMFTDLVVQLLCW